MRIIAAVLALAALAFGPLCLAQSPTKTVTAAPAITTSITVITESGQTAGVTVGIANTAPPSHAALGLPVKITLRDKAGATVSASTQTVTLPALDTHFTGSVTLDVPLSITVIGLEAGLTSTVDDQGTHIVIPITALDGGATYSTTFDAAAATTGTLDGGVTAQPITGIIANPVTATPVTTTPTAGN